MSRALVSNVSCGGVRWYRGGEAVGAVVQRQAAVRGDTVLRDRVGVGLRQWPPAGLPVP